MHDIKYIRKEPEAFDNAMKKRGLAPLSGTILELDRQKRGAVTDAQSLQEESNRLAKEIGALMGQGRREEAQPLLARSKEVKAQMAALKETAEKGESGDANDAVTTLLETLPNTLLDDVPEGRDEKDNRVVRTWGEPKTAEEFAFQPKDHTDLGEALSGGYLPQLDFAQTSKISGARFATLSGSLARLERALGNFMLDVQTKQFGYTEVSPPLLVRDAALYGTSQLPKFAEDSYKTSEHWLIPTSEVPLTNLVRETILEESRLPLRFTARTPCFRSEAGSAGKDTRGLIRQHQFYKVELVSVTAPEDAEMEHQRMLGCAESILQQLGLAYRVMLLCSGDTGFGSRKTYDLEVWLPGQNAYREISSVSQCGDFQARRMNARYRPVEAQKETRFVHTLNGSGLAVGRTLIAVMENYQQKDGSILLPSVLHSYMDGDSLIQ